MRGCWILSLLSSGLQALWRAAQTTSQACGEAEAQYPRMVTPAGMGSRTTPPGRMALRRDMPTCSHRACMGCKRQAAMVGCSPGCLIRQAACQRGASLARCPHSLAGPESQSAISTPRRATADLGRGADSIIRRSMLCSSTQLGCPSGLGSLLAAIMRRLDSVSMVPRASLIIQSASVRLYAAKLPN